ncbi:MAG: hypothetical protein KBF62_00385 [Candidatus Pacebacteria bacterium]|nr:hypothetical protein [Candidatus Paceibacterota bacterium]MBP9058081.1 hypothetical protein [Candidatus Paceibacterota bacterium]MBP9769975.1 hypothetical protein [Candidatus Paceibacterota bacterium]
MKQKTFHPLTATFISAVVQTLPTDISTEHMQLWIEHPKDLQIVLKTMLESSFTVIDNDDELYKGRLSFKITKIGDETFHQQTAKFIAVVVQSIPMISNDRMEFWSSHLNTLQRELRKTLLKNLVPNI